MKDVAFSLTTPENMLVFCNKTEEICGDCSFFPYGHNHTRPNLKLKSFICKQMYINYSAKACALSTAPDALHVLRTSHSTRSTHPACSTFFSLATRSVRFTVLTHCTLCTCVLPFNKFLSLSCPDNDVND